MTDSMTASMATIDSPADDTADSSVALPPELQRWLIWEACSIKNFERLTQLERTTQSTVESLKQRHTAVGFLIAATSEARADKQAVKQGTDTGLLLRQARERSELMRRAIEQQIPPLLGVFLERSSPDYARAGAALHDAATLTDCLAAYDRAVRDYLRTVGMARNVICANYRHAERRFSDHALVELQNLHRAALNIEGQGRQITRLCDTLNRNLAGTEFAAERFAAWSPTPWSYLVDTLRNSNIMDVQAKAAEILELLNQSLTVEVVAVREETARLQTLLSERATAYLHAYWKTLRDFALESWVTPEDVEEVMPKVEAWFNTRPNHLADVTKTSSTGFIGIQSVTSRIR